MIICPQCNGYKSTIFVQESLNAPNSMTFTAPTQTPLNVCNFCQGTGINTGAGT
jgi:hypothetical protein